MESPCKHQHFNIEGESKNSKSGKNILCRSRAKRLKAVLRVPNPPHGKKLYCHIAKLSGKLPQRALGTIFRRARRILGIPGTDDNVMSFLKHRRHAVKVF